jgi:glycosidase
MSYWVREADIDGFRCDVAKFIPHEFWQRAQRELNAIKPVFMLAEGDFPWMHERAFDATYGWDTAELMAKAAKGEADARTMKQWLEKPPQAYPADAYRMRFTSNHDFNSWTGTDQELYGPAYKAMAVLSFTLPGMPLIYNGQESGLAKRLEFFERDPIDWKRYELAPFYAGLAQLKHANPALWNGQYGGTTTVQESGNDKVFAFRRQLKGNTVDVAVNLSGTAQRYMLPGAPAATLPAWGWNIKTK